MTMQEKLNEWAKKTVKDYHDLASEKEINLAYYTQSPLSNIVDNPELMVVGINPGSKGTYSEQIENKNWTYLNQDKNHLDEKHLLEGNYCREEGKPSSWDNHKKWNYWSKLKRCLSESNLSTIIDDDSKVIITNASFFNTPKANEINEDLLEKTIPYTLELIQITNPKHLVFLSGEKCFGRLSRLAKLKFEYKHVCGRIYIGRLNGRLCIGIPHPAYKTNEELNLIASVIPYLFKLKNFEELDVELIKKECSKQIEDFNESINSDQSYRQPSNEEVNEIFENTTNQLISVLGKPFELNDKTQRFKLNNEIAITITKSEKGYIGIRHISFENKKKYPNELYPNTKLYTDILRQYGYDVLPQNGCWIGTKFFKNFDNYNESTTNNILSEISNILDLIKE